MTVTHTLSLGEYFSPLVNVNAVSCQKVRQTREQQAKNTFFGLAAFLTVTKRLALDYYSYQAFLSSTQQPVPLWISLLKAGASSPQELAQECRYMGDMLVP